MKRYSFTSCTVEINGQPVLGGSKLVYMGMTLDDVLRRAILGNAPQPDLRTLEFGSIRVEIPPRPFRRRRSR